MKPNQVRDLSQDELVDRLKGLKQELFRLRFQHATSQLESPMRIRQVKKDIARVHTIMTERARGDDAK
ncbi:MAG: 50S ribosomal protein L29 [Sulfobacillus sp.]